MYGIASILRCWSLSRAWMNSKHPSILASWWTRMTTELHLFTRQMFHLSPYFLIRKLSVNPAFSEGCSVILTIIVIVAVAIIDSCSSAVSPRAKFHYTLSKRQKWQWGIVGFFFPLPIFAKMKSIQEIVSLRAHATHLLIALSSHLASCTLAVVDF